MATDFSKITRRKGTPRSLNNDASDSEQNRRKEYLFNKEDALNQGNASISGIKGMRSLPPRPPLPSNLKIDDDNDNEDYFGDNDKTIKPWGGKKRKSRRHKRRTHNYKRRTNNYKRRTNKRRTNKRRIHKKY